MAFDSKLIRMGWFLGIRQLRRSSMWSNVLIVVIMVLTFLNLVVISGLLVGLIEGAVFAVRARYTGDLFITQLQEKDFIENSPNIISNLNIIDSVERYSARYTVSGTIESNYKERTNFEDEPDLVGTVIAGIDVEDEHAVTDIGNLIIEGEYLEEGDFDEVLIGALLLRRYLDIDSPGFLVLEDVNPGDKVRISIGGETREVRVKGILKSKVDEIDRRVFMTDSQLRAMANRDDMNLSEIAIKISSDSTPEHVKEILINNGIDKYAKIQTFEEGQPKFLQDIKDTFALLGSIVSSIGLIVASITIFIVIFINAITRRKFIGILKGIGVDGVAIEISYVFQSLIYALIGSLVGLFIVYVILLPYFTANPIDFPFSDGILVAPIGSTMIRIVLLIVTTTIAGYLPARMIVKKNTLDSILGR